VTTYVPTAPREVLLTPRPALSAPVSPATAATFVSAWASATISSAERPSTRSAFSPVATPVAFVVNGAAFGLPERITPTSGPPELSNSKARPSDRLRAANARLVAALGAAARERQP
jgi:hypothetical protein